MSTRTIGLVGVVALVFLLAEETRALIVAGCLVPSDSRVGAMFCLDSAFTFRVVGPGRRVTFDSAAHARRTDYFFRAPGRAEASAVLHEARVTRVLRAGDSVREGQRIRVGYLSEDEGLLRWLSADRQFGVRLDTEYLVVAAHNAELRAELFSGANIFRVQRGRVVPRDDAGEPSAYDGRTIDELQQAARGVVRQQRRDVDAARARRRILPPAPSVSGDVLAAYQLVLASPPCGGEAGGLVPVVFDELGAPEYFTGEWFAARWTPEAVARQVGVTPELGAAFLTRVARRTALAEDAALHLNRTMVSNADLVPLRVGDFYRAFRLRYPAAGALVRLSEVALDAASEHAVVYCATEGEGSLLHLAKAQGRWSIAAQYTVWQ